MPNTIECRYPVVHDPNVTNSLAIYSDGDNKKYRYLLERIWNPDLPVLMFVMSHASIATVRSNDGDQTVQICEDRARNHHLVTNNHIDFRGMAFGGVCITNIFAFIETDENPLSRETHPVGAENYDIIEEYARRDNTLVVCAWGIEPIHHSFPDRRNEMKDRLDGTGTILHYFPRLLLPSGQPRHVRRHPLNENFEVMP